MRSGVRLGRAVAIFLPLATVGVLALLPALPGTLRPIIAGIPDAPPLALIVAAQGFSCS